MDRREMMLSGLGFLLAGGSVTSHAKHPTSAEVNANVSAEINEVLAKFPVIERTYPAIAHGPMQAIVQAGKNAPTFDGEITFSAKAEKDCDLGEGKFLWSITIRSFKYEKK